MKGYKHCLDMIRAYLNNKTLKLNKKKPDAPVDEELEKPINEMDTHLIDLCLNALVAHRAYISGRKICNLTKLIFIIYTASPNPSISFIPKPKHPNESPMMTMFGCLFYLIIRSNC